MAKQMTEEQIYEEASKRVRARKRFYGGLATYLIVNAVLIVLGTVRSRLYVVPMATGYLGCLCPW